MSRPTCEGGVADKQWLGQHSSSSSIQDRAAQHEPATPNARIALRPEPMQALCSSPAPPAPPQETEAAASKQHAAAVQGLEQLRDSLASQAADAERKIERANKKASKMPELAQMLAPFLG